MVHLKFSRDLDYLHEQAPADPVSASAVDPENFVDQASAIADKILHRGQPSTAQDFQTAISRRREAPAQQPASAAEPEVRPREIPRQPQPEQTDDEHITQEDEDKFITWLQQVSEYAETEYREELNQPDPDRQYLNSLISLSNMVDQLEDQYAEPGVFTKQQHTANTRRLDKALHRALTHHPKREEKPQAAAELEPEPQEQPPEEVPQEEPQPAAEPQEEPSGVNRQLSRGDRGQFASTRDREGIADLIYRKQLGQLSADEEEKLQQIKQETPNDYRAGRRYLASARNRLHNLLRQDRLTPEQQEQVDQLQQQFPGLAESKLLDDPILRILFEQDDPESGAKIQLFSNGKWMRIWPDPDNPQMYWDLYTREEGGWPGTGIVEPEGASAQPEQPIQPQTATPQPAEPELSFDEKQIARAAQDAMDAVERVNDPESYQTVLQTIQDIWKQVDQIDHRKTRLKLKRGLQAARSQVQLQQRNFGQGAEQKAEPEDPSLSVTGADKLLQQFAQQATQYRTGLSWWSWGLQKAVGKLLGTGAQVMKSRESGKGTEYKVMSPAAKKPVYFWVPKQTESLTESVEPLPMYATAPKDRVDRLPDEIQRVFSLGKHEQEFRPRAVYECPKCASQECYIREVNADTGYDSMEGRCRECGYFGDAGTFNRISISENSSGSQQVNENLPKAVKSRIPRKDVARHYLEKAARHVRIDPFLEGILEQEIPIRTTPQAAGPKRAAPDAAFGEPPVPPDGDPVGGPGEDTPEAPELPEEPTEPVTPEEPVEPPPEDAPQHPKRVLVTQNNTWWVLSWPNWLQFLIQGASGSRWNLDHWGARVPEGKPADVRQFVSVDEGPPTYYSTEPTTNVYNVEGWQPRRFRKELDYIEAMDVANMSLVEPKPPSDEPTSLSLR